MQPAILRKKTKHKAFDYNHVENVELLTIHAGKGCTVFQHNYLVVDTLFYVYLIVHEQANTLSGCKGFDDRAQVVQVSLVTPGRKAGLEAVKDIAQ